MDGKIICIDINAGLILEAKRRILRRRFSSLLDQFNRVLGIWTMRRNMMIHRLLRKLNLFHRSQLIRILAQRLADLQRMADESELSDAPGMSASYLDQASSVLWIARCLNIHYEVREEARKYYEFD